MTSQKARNIIIGKLTSLWKITIFNGKTPYKWPFSIVMLVSQRVIIGMGICKGGTHQQNYGYHGKSDSVNWWNGVRGGPSGPNKWPQSSTIWGINHPSYRGISSMYPQSWMDCFSQLPIVCHEARKNLGISAATTSLPAIDVESRGSPTNPEGQ